MFLGITPTFNSRRKPAWPRAAQVNSGHPCCRGLVAGWLLGEGSGTSVRDVLGRHHGATQNTPVWTGTGKFGPALSFNGTTQYATITDTTSLRPPSLSVVAWFKLSGTPSFATVVCKPYSGPVWSSPFVSWLIRLNNSNTIEIDVGNGTTYTGASGTDSLTFSLSTGVWYQVGFSYDQSVLRMFVNGVFRQQATNVTGAVGYGSPPVMFAGDYAASPAGDYFPGTIDHCLLYNRALSDAEFSQLYFSPFAFLAAPQTRRTWVNTTAAAISYPQLERGTRGLARGMCLGLAH